MNGRFADDQLEQHCGPESGDWSVMSTTLAGGHAAYGIAHRRGGVVSSLPLLCLLAARARSALDSSFPFASLALSSARTFQRMAQHGVGRISATRMMSWKMARQARHASARESSTIGLRRSRTSTRTIGGVRISSQSRNASRRSHFQRGSWIR